MHKINRNSVEKPACFAPLDSGSRYSDLHSSEKYEIRDRLLEMQKERCAYCERRTGRERDDGHIEHFRNQASHKHLECEWTNMFWSCQDEKTCGKHKDKCDILHGTSWQRAFDTNDLIDPCFDDPDEYLLFVYDGTVIPRPNISEDKFRRATETLRVFQLAESPYLRKAREDAVLPYKISVDTLLPLGEQILKAYLQSVIIEIESVPFSTAVKHYLGGLLN